MKRILPRRKWIPSRGKGEPSPANVGEGHGRREDLGNAAPKNPAAYGERNAGPVGPGTGETPLCPLTTSRVTGPISSDPAKWHGMPRWGVGGAHITADGADNITHPREGALLCSRVQRG